MQRQNDLLADVGAIMELLGDSEDEELLCEAAGKLADVRKSLDDMEFHLMLSGPNDACGAILAINAGAGGTEACDWADMLLRMYRRWADRHGFKNEVVDFTQGDGAGFRGVTLTVAGEYAYGYLKAEIGVHRLVRISPFDANKRRHTSFASVDVLPDIEDDIEIEILEKDLRVDTFRSGGAGGQHVNKTDSAVRITHLPTNIAVACQKERSQHRNREIAMKLLKAKLYELEMEKKRKERQAVEDAKSDIAWGSQIRSYVLQPYRMAKDHRTGLEIGNVDAVLDGALDEFIHAFLKKHP
jgi:peptide chain release factor 2